MKNPAPEPHRRNPWPWLTLLVVGACVVIALRPQSTATYTVIAATASSPEPTPETAVYVGVDGLPPIVRVATEIPLPTWTPDPTVQPLPSETPYPDCGYGTGKPCRQSTITPVVSTMPTIAICATLDPGHICLDPTFVPTPDPGWDR